eukprot:1319915-Prymnesium_polylepis.2
MPPDSIGSKVVHRHAGPRHQNGRIGRIQNERLPDHHMRRIVRCHRRTTSIDEPLPMPGPTAHITAPAPRQYKANGRRFCRQRRRRLGARVLRLLADMSNALTLRLRKRFR